MSLRIAEAMALTSAAHAAVKQLDKNGAPYFLHPMRVMNAVRQAGYGEPYQIVAVGHDTVEDTNLTIEDWRERFGDEVATGLIAVTHLKGEETYKDYIFRCAANTIGRVVKRYDVYDNADPRRYCEGVPIKRYIWTLDYLDSLARQEREIAEHRMAHGILS